jgi:hypothetical protein
MSLLLYSTLNTRGCQLCALFLCFAEKYTRLPQSAQKHVHHRCLHSRRCARVHYYTGA